MKQSTLGLIETYGFIGAVEALDVSVKAANVELVSCEFVKGGIVTILITGEVASVKAAVEASAVAVEKLGVLRNTHVIARADDGVWDMLQDIKNSNLIEEKVELSGIVEDKNKLENNNEKPIEDCEKIKVTEKTTDESLKDKDNCEICRTREELEGMKVSELRVIARGIENISLTKKQIKFCKKEQLIESIFKDY